MVTATVDRDASRKSLPQFLQLRCKGLPRCHDDEMPFDACLSCISVSHRLLSAEVIVKQWCPGGYLLFTSDLTQATRRAQNRDHETLFSTDGRELRQKWQRQ